MIHPRASLPDKKNDKSPSPEELMTVLTRSLTAFTAAATLALALGAAPAADDVLEKIKEAG